MTRGSEIVDFQNQVNWFFQIRFFFFFSHVYQNQNNKHIYSCVFKILILYFVTLYQMHITLNVTKISISYSLKKKNEWVFWWTHIYWIQSWWKSENWFDLNFHKVQIKIYLWWMIQKYMMTWPIIFDVIVYPFIVYRALIIWYLIFFDIDLISIYPYECFLILIHFFFTKNIGYRITWKNNISTVTSNHDRFWIIWFRLLLIW